MPKNSKPDEFGEECLPGGPNGWCKRHRYPWAMCAAVAARRDEEGGVMAEMTPERKASEIVAGWLALFMPYETKPTVTLRCVLEARIADALRAERDEVAAYAVHEAQTHHSLGAILGTDDSLEACARRMKERAERAEELLKRVPQAVDFLVQHRTLIRLRDTLRSLANQADGAIHDAVEPSRLADVERERDNPTREVERLIAALNWALGTGNLGTGNEFAPRGPNDAPYWWRPELQRRAGLVWDGEQFVVSAALDG